jgi:WD40 repeat protein
MKVFGEVQHAQLENLPAAPLASSGRIYADNSDAARLHPTLYRGTAWERVTVESDFKILDVGSSGTAKTIDWADGLVQKVTLTGHCEFSFSNSRPGRSHTLIVVQSVATAFMVRFPQDIYWSESPVQPQHIGLTRLKVFRFAHSPAVLAAITLPPAIVVNPSTTIPGTVAAIAVSPDGKYLAAAHATSPFLSVYALADFLRGGFGAKAANPATLPSGAGKAVAWSPDGKFVGIAHTGSPFLSVYPFETGVLGVKVANPAVLPPGPGDCTGISWSPTGDTIVVAMQNSPFIRAWPWSATGFGVVANPGSLVTGPAQSVAFGPRGDFIALGIVGGGPNAVSLYAWNAGFGARTVPATPPIGSVNNLAFSPLGDYLACANASTVPLVTYPIDNLGVFSAAVASPPGLPGAVSGLCVAWSPQGDYVSLGVSLVNSTTSMPYIYPFSAGVFSASLTAPAGGVGSMNSVAYSPSAEFILSGGTDSVNPYLTLAQNVRGVKNYLKLIE